MRNRKQKIKYILLLCVFSMFLIASCKRSETGKTVESKEVINAQWENAAHTPYGKYPELVTYTLGKIVGSNNANLPVKATYEDNAYTRYLKERLNIQMLTSHKNPTLAQLCLKFREENTFQTA